MVLLLDLAILSEIILARPPITECSSIVKTCLKLLSLFFIFSLRGFKVCISLVVSCGCGNLQNLISLQAMSNQIHHHEFCVKHKKLKQ